MLTIEEKQALTAVVYNYVRSGHTPAQAFANAFDQLGSRMLTERQKSNTDDSPELLHLQDCFDFLQGYAELIMRVQEETP
jgi:hypothetical protein